MNLVSARVQEFWVSISNMYLSWKNPGHSLSHFESLRLKQPQEKPKVYDSKNSVEELGVPDCETNVKHSFDCQHSWYLQTILSHFSISQNVIICSWLMIYYTNLWYHMHPFTLHPHDIYIVPPLKSSQYVVHPRCFPNLHLKRHHATGSEGGSSLALEVFTTSAHLGSSNRPWRFRCWEKAEMNFSGSTSSHTCCTHIYLYTYITHNRYVQN